MSRAGSRSAALIGLCSAVVACGGLSPRDQDVYHEASLRPGAVIAETEAERQLLAQLPSLPANEPIELGDRVYLPLASYSSASGRDCRAVRESGSGADRTRVACEDDGTWVFVPDIFGGDDPFASAVGTP